MGNLSNRAIHSIFGCPTEGETIKIDVVSTSSGVQLDTNQIYRVVSEDDCYITFGTSADSATDAGVLLIGAIPEMFSTTGKEDYIHAIRKNIDTELYVTKMKTRGQ